MARQARLTLFDEPEAGIDLWSFQNLIRIFQKLRDEIADSSILMISHQERILSIADEIVVLTNGRIEKHGPAQDVLREITGTQYAVRPCGKMSEMEEE